MSKAAFRSSQSCSCKKASRKKGEHPCGSVIPTKLLGNFNEIFLENLIEITLPHKLYDANSLHPPPPTTGTPHHKTTLAELFCVFLSRIDYSNNSTNPKLYTYFLQIPHGQFLGFHLLISFLKMFKEVMFFCCEITKLL